MTRFELNILGCGSATISLRHMPSSQVLNIRDNLFMIDCGEGTQMQMRRMKLKFSRLNHIFISHLHGDHCFGLPGLLSTMALLGKTGTVTVHTFADGAEQLAHVMNYFCRETPFVLKFNIITTREAVIYDDDAISISTFPLHHRVPAVGFLFREKPKLRHIDSFMVKEHDIPLHALNGLRQGLDYTAPDGTVIPNSELTTPPDRAISYAYCSDTAFSHKVAQAVKGVDWLYHEATYDNSLAPLAAERCHSTAGQAAAVALEAGARHLVIGHFSKRYTDNSLLLEQARDVFPRTDLADEGKVFDLNKP